MGKGMMYRCQECAGDVEVTPIAAICERCGRTSPLLDGIPSFASRTSYFFGELPREQMRALAQRTCEVGWKRAFHEVLRVIEEPLADHIEQYIEDPSRAAWKYLLRLPKDGVALDLGCGWGTTSLSLASSVGRVVSMDLTLERLLLLQARADSLGRNNLEFVHGGDRLPLPFPDASFDLVVLNGVLEWVPVNAQGKPRAVQLAMLKEVSRVLKPAGQLYLGIENRFGFRYFLGRPEEHIKLRYVSLMPRALANWWGRKAVGGDYRTHTYGMRGYRRLFREAGLPNAFFYCPYPDYREFDTIVDVDSKRAVRSLFSPRKWWKRLLVSAAARTGVLGRMLPGFGVVGSKRADRGGFLSDLCQSISGQMRTELSIPDTMKATPSGDVLLLCRQKGQSAPTVLVRVSDRDSGGRRSRSTRLLQQVLTQTDHKPAAMRALAVIPQLYAHGWHGHEFYTAEEIKPGIPGTSVVEAGKVESAIPSVVDWLISFQQLSRGAGEWTGCRLKRFISRLYKTCTEFVPKLGKLQENVLDAPVDGLFKSTRLPAVCSHGDLHLGNTLFTEDGRRLTGVVDWDLLRSRGLPLTDVLYCLLMHRMEMRRQPYSVALLALFNRGALSSVERAAIDQYERVFELPSAYYRIALLAMTLGNLRDVGVRRPGLLRRLLPGVNEFLSEMVTTLSSAAGEEMAADPSLEYSGFEP